MTERRKAGPTPQPEDEEPEIVTPAISAGAYAAAAARRGGPAC